MEEKLIVTISREYGSGGRVIGEKLAAALGIPFYDKELISLAAKESGFQEEFFENAEKQSVNSLLYMLSAGMYNTVGQIDGVSSLPLNDRLFLIQYNVIRDIAQKGSCVIVGRCADYVLKDDPSLVKVFIHADLDKRVKRAVEVYGLSPDRAKGAVQKMDKRRGAYYEYYTGMKWGRAEHYDLTLDSGAIGLENAGRLIHTFVDMRKTPV